MILGEERQILIARARAGDRAASWALLEECRPSLVAFINTLLPPYLRTQVAEELAQDVYTLALTKLDGFAWRDFESAGAWLKEIARNRHADWLKYILSRKRDYRRIVSTSGTSRPDELDRRLLEQAVAVEESPSKLARRREHIQALEQAMGSVLTDRERTAITVRYLEMRPVTEVAALMECSPGYVKNLCLSGKQKLREALGRSSEFISSR